MFMHLVISAMLVVSVHEPARSPAMSPEERAITFLVREVPNWFSENQCYSCHNNGDAARALFIAKRLGYQVPDNAIADTLEFLTKPEQWDENGPEGPFKDKQLARLQFAGALHAAVEARDANAKALRSAAQLVASNQHEDGSWNIEPGELIGSPATHGRPLATALASMLLNSTDSDRYETAVQSAKKWLEQLPIRNTLDAAAVLLSNFQSTAMSAQRDRAMRLLARGQSSTGGWGPYVTAAPEPFDTAVVLIALHRNGGTSGVKEMIERGRSYLIANQHDDGSWVETTRPPGASSYAQRLSTAGWATQAILVTKTGAPPR